MISYTKKILPNGLTVLAHCDPSSQMAAVNVLYKVGSRNETPHRTGFAHLFEHLMFRGTELIPDFDMPIQVACGENNAFTNNDYTDYYITLPKENIETALWLESDRMTGLKIDNETLEGEKKVVLEEFNQRYLNQPYGDLWMLLREMAYTVHPYRWATIGATPDHIRDATLEEVEAFYKAHYHPSNAIVSIASGIDPDQGIALVEKWFSHIPNATPSPTSPIPAEPVQTEARRVEVERDVPSTMILIAFKMGNRLSEQHYLCDMISDILSGGTSSRLYQQLVKEKKLFSSANAYITGDIDPGLFVVSGQLLNGTTVEQAEEAIYHELERMKTELVGDYELEKVKNKFEAEITFGEINIMNKAMNLGFYEFTGDIGLINREVEIYRSITPARITQASCEVFDRSQSSTLVYKPIKK